MPRPFAEKLKDPVWWLEHAAHGWIGAACGLLGGGVAIFLTSPFVAFFAGLGLAMVAAVARELIQNLGDEDNDVLDAVADAVFTTLGGALAGLPYVFVEIAG